MIGIGVLGSRCWVSEIWRCKMHVWPVNKIEHVRYILKDTQISIYEVCMVIWWVENGGDHQASKRWRGVVVDMTGVGCMNVYCRGGKRKSVRKHLRSGDILVRRRWRWYLLFSSALFILCFSSRFREQEGGMRDLCVCGVCWRIGMMGVEDRWWYDGLKGICSRSEDDSGEGLRKVAWDRRDWIWVHHSHTLTCCVVLVCGQRNKITIGHVWMWIWLLCSMPRRAGLSGEGGR